MRALILVAAALFVVACGGGGSTDGGTGGGSGGGAGGGSGGGRDGGTDAGTPKTAFTATGGVTATIQTSGPIAAYQVSSGRSGIEFATTPASAVPGIYLGISKAGMLAPGTLDVTTGGFACALSVTADAGFWLAAQTADGGPNATGSCSVNLTSVDVRFTAVDGTSYAVHGTVTATGENPGSPDVTVNASF